MDLIVSIPELLIYSTDAKYENANYYWYFHIFKQIKFHSELSMKKALNPRGQSYGQ